MHQIQDSAQISLPLSKIVAVGGVPTTTSLDVAEYFAKSHKHVLRDVRGIQSEMTALRGGPKNGPSEFEPFNYVNAQHRPMPAYRMTRDGFTLLAMGFTGKRALAFKLAYIEAFNRMEAQLRGESAELVERDFFEESRALIAEWQRAGAPESGLLALIRQCRTFASLAPDMMRCSAIAREVTAATGMTHLHFRLAQKVTAAVRIAESGDHGEVVFAEPGDVGHALEWFKGGTVMVSWPGGATECDLSELAGASEQRRTLSRDCSRFQIRVTMRGCASSSSLSCSSRRQRGHSSLTPAKRRHLPKAE